MMTDTRYRFVASALASLLFAASNTACDTDPGDIGETASGSSGSNGGEDGGGSTSAGEPATSAAPETSAAETSGSSGGDPVTATATESDGSGSTTDGTTATTGDGGGESSTGEPGDPQPVADCSECDGGQVCLAFVAFTTEFFCAPMPATCVGDIDCACGAQLCNEIYDVCIEPPEAGRLNCECSAC